MAGVLFLAFVYFAVGQAAVLRNGVQTAADAAALAAAQDARDQLREGWIQVVDDPALWQRFIRGDGYIVEHACEKAGEFASLNDAELTSEGCEPLELGFTVTVESMGTVGDSLVPDMEGRRATATASAVLEPLCRFDPTEPRTPPTAQPSPSGAPTAEPEEEEPEPIEGLSCGGDPWVIDPEDPLLPDVDELFHVRLTGDDE